MESWKLMAAIVVSGGLLLLLLLLATNAQASPPLEAPANHAPALGEAAGQAWTPLALVGGTALLAGGAWIGTLERAGRRPCRPR
jgi:hypothetical protein